jgi:hypothetical protein
MFFDKPTNLSWDETYDIIPCVELPISCKWISVDNMTEQEKIDNPNHVTIGGYLKKINIPIQEAFPVVWAKMDDETRDKFMSLPNFDADKFFQCTGVDVRKKECKEMTVEEISKALGYEVKIVKENK